MSSTAALSTCYVQQPLRSVFGKQSTPPRVHSKYFVFSARFPAPHVCFLNFVFVGGSHTLNTPFQDQQQKMAAIKFCQKTFKVSECCSNDTIHCRLTTFSGW
jgi:hypothetical protein